MVARKVEQFFGRAPVVRINPDEVVGAGRRHPGCAARPRAQARRPSRWRTRASPRTRSSEPLPEEEGPAIGIWLALRSPELPVSAAGRAAAPPPLRTAAPRAAPKAAAAAAERSSSSPGRGAHGRSSSTYPRPSRAPITRCPTPAPAETDAPMRTLPGLPVPTAARPRQPLAAEPAPRARRAAPHRRDAAEPRRRDRRRLLRHAHRGEHARPVRPDAHVRHREPTARRRCACASRRGRASASTRTRSSASSSSPGSRRRARGEHEDRGDLRDRRRRHPQRARARREDRTARRRRACSSWAPDRASRHRGDAARQAAHPLAPLEGRALSGGRHADRERSACTWSRSRRRATTTSCACRATPARGRQGGVPRVLAARPPRSLRGLAAEVAAVAGGDLQARRRGVSLPVSTPRRASATTGRSVEASSASSRRAPSTPPPPPKVRTLEMVRADAAGQAARASRPIGSSRRAGSRTRASSSSARASASPTTRSSPSAQDPLRGARARAAVRPRPRGDAASRA